MEEDFVGTGNQGLKAVGEPRSTIWTNRCLASRLESSPQTPNEQAVVVRHFGGLHETSPIGVAVGGVNSVTPRFFHCHVQVTMCGLIDFSSPSTPSTDQYKPRLTVNATYFERLSERTGCYIM